MSELKNELKLKLDEWILDQKMSEYSENTLKQYRANTLKLINWLNDDIEELNKEIMIEFKKYLSEIAGSTRSINTWIVTVNKFLKYIGKKDLCIKKIKIQMKASNENTLSLTDYKRLLRYSKKLGLMQLHYIMKVLAMTGIRIDELKFFTVENIKSKDDSIKVFNKGKEREIVIRNDLKRELRKYCRENKLNAGFIFLGEIKGKMPAKSTIWRQMKKVAGAARVNKKKIHAHSFRHLFAQVFLNTYVDNITELADILGHNSLETTREYTKTSSEQKRKKLENIKF